MMQAQAIDTTTGGGVPAVEIRVLADATQLSVVRGIAGALAVQHNFDLDAIADLRLAVDEACTQLIRRAVPSSQLICVFRFDGPGIQFAGSVPTASEAEVSDRGFGWHVLRTLTDDVSIENSSSPRSGSVTTIEFTKAVAGEHE